MGLLNLLNKSVLGLKGLKPKFSIDPNPPGSYHDTYSIDGKPLIKTSNINNTSVIPNPSRLDERDIRNNNKYKSLNNKYLDNPPR